MVGEVRNPARNPALSRLCRRPLRPAARHPLRHAGHGGDAGTRRPSAGCSRPSTGASVSCRYYIMASGCLSAPKPPEIDGVKDFKGEVYFTGRWPHDGVEFAGKRVAVIGTGSSGIQAIPLIAEQAAHLTVFQRTPNFAFPAHNGPQPAERVALLASDLAGYREQARLSLAGVPLAAATEFSWQLSEAERRERFEQALAAGDLVVMLSQLWADQGVDLEGNALVGRPAPREHPVDRQGSGDRRGAHRRATIRSAPSVPASIPTTTRPTTGPTSPWSICGRSRSRRSRRPASGPTSASSTSM